MPISRETRADKRRPHREKCFGRVAGRALDCNAKARIIAYAHAWSATHKAPGQHRGPITRAFMDVLEALLWGFHNSCSGRCFPSYEAIAAKARCARSTVADAIKALEFARVLTWVHRLAHIRVPELDLFGRRTWRRRVIRTSNANSFRDPQLCPLGRPDPRLSSKSENPPGTPAKESSSLPSATGQRPIDPDSPLGRALNRLGRAVEGRLLVNGAG